MDNNGRKVERANMKKSMPSLLRVRTREYCRSFPAAPVASILRVDRRERSRFGRSLVLVEAKGLKPYDATGKHLINIANLPPILLL